MSALPARSPALHRRGLLRLPRSPAHLVSAVRRLDRHLLLAVLLRGLTWGIEFKGGADFKAPTTVTATSVEEMRVALESSGVPDWTKRSSAPSETPRSACRPGLSIPPLRCPKCGRPSPPKSEFPPIRWPTASSARPGAGRSRRALIALAVFLALVGIVIWAYFRNGTMSAAALIALGHDLILTIGIYALVGFTVTPPR